MGLTLSIQGTGLKWSSVMDSDELEGVHSAMLINSDLQRAYAILFGEQMGTARHVSVHMLAEAVDTISKAIAPGLNVTIYSIVGGAYPEDALTSASSVSGFTIGGEFCRLRGGVERCVLERIQLSSDGKKVEIISREDVRHLSQIQTDSWGKLKIRKRKKVGRVLTVLRGIKEALARMPSSAAVEVIFG